MKKNVKVSCQVFFPYKQFSHSKVLYREKDVHNLVNADDFISSNLAFFRADLRRIRSDFMMKYRNRPRFDARECMEIHAGRVGYKD